MIRNKQDFCIAMFNRMLLVMGVFSYGILMTGLGSHKTNYVNNIENDKSIEVSRIINVDKKAEEPTTEALYVDNMEEALLYGPNANIMFTGQMTAYNPVCVGCTGRVACPPGQDVRNGNIYYEDKTYGKIRIVAADPHIPCGTLVKISNVSFSNEPIMAIVLDRGGVIKGNIMDFLMTENDDMDIVGRQHNVNYEIIRWGW